MFSKQKILFLIITVALLSPLISCADTIWYGLYQPATPGGQTILTLVASIINVAWILFVGIGVICILIAGIMFLTAAGAPDKLQKARAALIWGVVGIAVGILAFSIFKIVDSLLGGGY